MSTQFSTIRKPWLLLPATLSMVVCLAGGCSTPGGQPVSRTTLLQPDQEDGLGGSFVDSQDIRTIAGKMTVARLLERDDFSKRYQAGAPISCHEFLYPLMQGYDSVMVQADVEIGGSDQTFNLLVGRNLQKDAGQKPQVALTLPLLVGTDGELKMSKSYGNQIDVGDPAFGMYGKAMSIPDSLLRSYFDLATDISAEETERLLREAIALHLEGMKEDGLPIPEPSSIVDYLELEACV